jgi:citrate lyase gamma subunit
VSTQGWDITNLEPGAGDGGGSSGGGVISGSLDPVDATATDASISANIAQQFYHGCSIRNPSADTQAQVNIYDAATATGDFGTLDLAPGQTVNIWDPQGRDVGVQGIYWEIAAGAIEGVVFMTG